MNSRQIPSLLWTAAGTIEGVLELPAKTTGLVIVPQASATRRQSNWTRQITSEFQRAGLATFAIDLLTGDEEQIDSRTEHYRLDVSLLSRRIVMAVRWLREQEAVAGLPIGCFCTGPTVPAAFRAAEILSGVLQALVCYRGMDSHLLPAFATPTLLLVEEDDVLLVHRNRELFDALRGRKELILLSEDADLASLGRLAGDWFLRYLGTRRVESEADAKGAVESQMELLESVVGEETLGYLGIAHEEHTGEPIARTEASRVIPAV